MTLERFVAQLRSIAAVCHVNHAQRSQYDPATGMARPFILTID